MYREVAPPRALAGLVDCFWRYERRESAGGDPGVILPDGRTDIVWITGSEPLVAGPQTTFLARSATAPFVAVGARFHPGVGPPLLGLAARELIDMHVPLSQIDARPASRLSAALPEVDAPSERARMLASALLDSLDRADSLDQLVRNATGLLERPAAGVDGTARAVGLSERQLRRRFHEAVGYGPKTFQRIARFQRFLSELGSGSDGLAGAALASGYADQAHLTREARRLSGMTPAQLAVWARS